MYETGRAVSPVVDFGDSGVEHAGSATRELIYRGRLTEWSH